MKEIPKHTINTIIRIYGEICDNLYNDYKPILTKMTSFKKGDELIEDIQEFDKCIAYSTLAAYVCEIMLKYLIYPKEFSKKGKDGHDLLKLFNDLDGEQKLRIINLVRSNYSIDTDDEFYQLLHDTSLRFVENRYFFEESSANCDNEFLKVFFDSLRTYINENVE